MPRDISQPLTELELDGLRSKFRKLPAYREGGWISATDIPKLYGAMDFPRTPEQIKAYVDYNEKHLGGILVMETFIATAEKLHDITELVETLPYVVDLNKDGVIQANEFEDLLKLLVVHDPAFGKGNIAFEEFLREADLNKDGKVSIPECISWLKKKLKT